MNGKKLLIFIVAVVFFTLAAKYRFHDSAHAMGMIKKGGGMVRHPALLDKDKDTYMLIATAAVVPPYQGNARVVLEGDPSLTATFHNSEPAVDLGIHRHPRFRDNTYYDLRPKDRIALWVKIHRSRVATQQHGAVDLVQKRSEGGTAPVCDQCEPEDDSATKNSGKRVYSGAMVEQERRTRAVAGGADHGVSRKGEGQDTATASGGTWRGKQGGEMSTKGPALAFYDLATNEPLLRIPIRFTGVAGGGDGDH